MPPNHCKRDLHINRPLESDSTLLYIVAPVVVRPDVASKNHTEKITYVIDKSLKDSGLALEEIKKVFVTNGPGLINCLMIGVTAAKTICLDCERLE